MSGIHTVTMPGSPRSQSLVHQSFLQRVRETPDAVATIHEGISRTYAEIELRSRRLAGQLRQKGMIDGGRIALLAERCDELIWAILAVLRLGGVFIIVDSTYPVARIEALLNLSRPQALILAGGSRLKDISDHLTVARNMPVMTAGSDFRRFASISDRLDHASPLDPAYFLFTSGSTGVPKCVVCNHVPLVHFVQWQSTTFGLDRHDRFTMLSGLSHDPLLRDIFTPLSLGATILIPTQPTIVEPGALRPWLLKTHATVIHLTPAMGKLIVSGGLRPPALPDLRHLFWGGDQLISDMVSETGRIAPNAKQTNFYGCTETPQAVGYFECNVAIETDTVPIGRGSDGFELFVVDDDKKPVQGNAPGEIGVRSKFLSVGYVIDGMIKQPEDRVVDADGENSTYYTGDRGRYLPSGDILMLGRVDDQVKIRGYRVELSEVTEVLLSHPKIRTGIALPIGEGLHIQIHAFIVTYDQSDTSVGVITKYLSDRLPGPMVPTRIWKFDGDLPMLPNGKVDRIALQAHARNGGRPVGNPTAEHTIVDDVERNLIAKWANIFGIHTISHGDSFSSLGGDSLSYVEAYLASEDLVGTLPIDWPEKSISELVASRSKLNVHLMTIDSSMLIRAVSIVLIVAFHSGLANYGDGLTSALFVVSGYLFGEIQFREIFRRGSSACALVPVRNLLAPTILFTAILALVLLFKGRLLPLSALLLSADLVDYTTRRLPFNLNEVALWYIECLIHILLLIYLLTSVAIRIPILCRRPFAVGLTLFSIGCLGRFVLPDLIQPSTFASGVPKLSFFDLAPSTHFASFVVGLILANIGSRSERIWFGIVVLGYAALSAPFYGVTAAIAVGGAAIVLMTMTRVRLPRLLAKGVFILSGASLFIYLTHSYTGTILKSALNAGPVIKVAGGLVVGIAVHAAWQRATIWLRRFFRSGSIPSTRPSNL
jgi:amino acid adenylation domain-containing protein